MFYNLWALSLWSNGCNRKRHDWSHAVSIEVNIIFIFFTCSTEGLCAENALHLEKMKNPRYFGGVGLERMMGVEPTYAAWEAAVLPMNYTREER